MSLNPSTVPTFTLSSGTSVPVIGMGTFGNDRYAPEQVAWAVKGAALAGYRFFDCAAAYQNEAAIGVALASAMEEGSIARSDLFMCSILHLARIPVAHPRLASVPLDLVPRDTARWPRPCRSGCRDRCLLTGCSRRPLQHQQACGNPGLHQDGCHLPRTGSDSPGRP